MIAWRAAAVGVVRVVSVQLPSIENAMIRKQKAADRMEVLGDSLTKRLLGFRNGPSGVVALHHCEEGAPVANLAKVEEGT